MAGKKPVQEIRIGEESFPFRMTMGALVRFKRLTGKEISELNDGDIEDICALVYCCIQSSCAADKIPFEKTFLDFCDGISDKEAGTFAESIRALAEGNSQPSGQKKR